MTNREFVKAAFKGELDNSKGIPSTFSLHFPEEDKFGERAIKAHLDFFNDTDTEILKIMNENAFPSNPGVYSASDFKRIKVQNKNSDFIKNEVELFKRILDKADPDAYYMVTIQGTIASLGHSMRPQYGPLSDIRKLQVEAYRENKEILKDANLKVAESLCNLIDALSEAGADGFYYALLGGEKWAFSREEASELIEPADIMVLKQIRENKKDSILHLCKKELDFERFIPYSPYFDALNWGVYENNISLTEGIRLYPGKVIVGGLENRSGIIVDGTESEIRDEVIKIRKEVGDVPFILGADCTLKTDQDRNKIRAAVKAAREIL